MGQGLGKTEPSNPSTLATGFGRTLLEDTQVGHATVYYRGGGAVMACTCRSIRGTQQQGVLWG